MTKQLCRICREMFDMTEEHFHRRSSYVSGFLGTCKKCTIERDKRTYYKRTYGIPIEEKDSMLDRQKGLCRICQKLMSNPQTDHDHETGEVRGLLCSSCNKALGFFGDNVLSLRRAIQYLEGTLNATVIDSYGGKR